MYILKQFAFITLSFIMLYSYQYSKQIFPTYLEISDTNLPDTLSTIIITKDSTMIDSTQRSVFSYNNFRDYIFSHLKYPPQAIKQKIEGKVYIHFVLAKDGNVSDVRLVKPVHPLLDSTALELILRMPRWQPFVYKGSPQQLSYTIPIIFELKE